MLAALGGIAGTALTRSTRGAGIGALVGGGVGLLFPDKPKPQKRSRVYGEPVVIEVPGEGSATAIARAYGIPGELAQSIVGVAHRVGADPFDLANLIRFETGGTFHPAQQSGLKLGAPFNSSRATGLIQFVPSTAASLGTSTAALAKMSAVQQMAYVEQYLREVGQGRRGGPAGPMDTAQALFMAVFYPAARYWTTTSKFPAWVQEGNPGIFTPLDYLEKALRYAKLPSTFTPVQAAGLVDLAGWVVTGGLEATQGWLVDGVEEGLHPSGVHAGVGVGFVPARSWQELAAGPGPYSLERIFLISNYQPDQFGWASIPSTMSAYGSALANTPAAVYLPTGQMQFGTGYGPAYTTLPHNAVAVQPPSYAWQPNVYARTAPLARNYALGLIRSGMLLEIPFRAWPGGIAHGVTYRPANRIQSARARTLATAMARAENLRAVWFEGTIPGTETVYFTAAPQILLRQVQPPKKYIPHAAILAGLDEDDPTSAKPQGLAAGY